MQGIGRRHSRNYLPIIDRAVSIWFAYPMVLTCNRRWRGHCSKHKDKEETETSDTWISPFDNTSNRTPIVVSSPPGMSLGGRGAGVVECAWGDDLEWPCSVICFLSNEGYAADCHLQVRCPMPCAQGGDQKCMLMVVQAFVSDRFPPQLQTNSGVQHNSLNCFFLKKI